MSANGMAVIATGPGKTRERVRLHAQLGTFPLLTEATIVRSSKTRGGYRWGLRFERLDDRTRANLEAFVRHQLAMAARVRQAQLYAARMKSVPLPPNVAPQPAPTPAPVPEPTAPARPIETDLSSTAVERALASEVAALSQQGAESASPTHLTSIDLPAIPKGAPIDVGLPMGAKIQASAPTQDGGYGSFQPYTPPVEVDEASLLDDGPLSQPAPREAVRPDPTVTLPESPVSTAASPAAERPADATVMLPETPEQRSPDATVMLTQSPEPAPAQRKPDATVMLPDQGLPAGVYQIDIDEDANMSLEDILKEVEDESPADAPLPSSTPTPAAAALPPLQGPTPDVAPGGTMIPGGMGSVDAGLAPPDAPFTLGLGSGVRKVVRSADPSPALEEPPADAAMGAVLPPPLDSDETVALEREAPVLTFRDADEIDEDQGELHEEISAEAPLAFEEELSAESSDAAMMGVPFDAGPPTHPEHFEPFEAPAFEEPVVMPEAIEVGAEVPQSLEMPAESPPLDDAPPLDEARPPGEAPVSIGEPIDLDEEPPDVSAFEPPVRPAKLDDDSAVSFADADRVDELRAPTLVESPGPSIYPDDVAPFDPYDAKSADTPVPPSADEAQQADPELPPPVDGIYTPIENRSLDEHSGAYDRASFEPFPSPTEHDLYAASTVAFEEQRDDPRLRLASLQRNVKAAEEVSAEHSMYLGDIEGVTTNLTPTNAKLGMTDESLPVVAFEDGGIRDLDEAEAAVPEPAAAAPTRPLQADAVDRTDGRYDPIAARSEQVGPVMHPTDPGFNVVPDFQAGPDRDHESAQVEPEGPRTGGTVVVADSRMLDLLRVPEEGPEASQSAADFAAMPSFGTQAGAAMAGFTVVAAYDDPEPGAGGTMVATAQEVEAWKEKGSLDLGGALGRRDSFEEEDDAYTSTFTPAPTELDHEGEPRVDPEETARLGPAVPAPEHSFAPLEDGASSLDEKALTAMRVAAGSGGDGFQLNPRGPAPAPAPIDGRPLDLEEPAPGPSPRRSTDIDKGGGPAPARAPTRPEPAVEPVRKVPQLRGSGPIDELPTGPHPAVPQAGSPSPVVPPRRSLVEDALAQLKRRTDERRRERGDEPAPKKVEPKSMKGKRRRTLSRAQASDPRLAELFKAALSDIEGKRE